MNNEGNSVSEDDINALIFCLITAFLLMLLFGLGLFLVDFVAVFLTFIMLTLILD